MKFQGHMVLIADSGSTKTHWRLLDGERIEQFETQGLHPSFAGKDEYESILKPLSDSYGSVKEVCFYSAGCAEGSEGSFIIQQQLQHYFKHSEVHVYSDLLAAAHACYGEEVGMIGILGTGSNTALYADGVLQQKVPSLGYVLGDEGSGAHLGKLLLSAAIRSDLSAGLLKKIRLDKEEVLHKLYQSAYPNRYLASFAPFLFRNRMEPEIAFLIQESFGLFVDRYVSPYGEGQTLSVVGSIGYYFRLELQRALLDKGHYLDQVLEHPIAALSLYYLGK